MADEIYDLTTVGSTTLDTVTSTDSTVTSTDSTITVSTDQADYAPTSTAIFTATDVTDGGTVVFDVTHVEDPSAPIGVSEWTVTDNGAGDLDPTLGVVATNWYVDAAAADQSFVLTATDATTGSIATTGFTDTPPPSVHTPVPAIVPVALNNGIVFLTGDVGTATGTGIFPSFVEIQGDNQSGGSPVTYNNDGTASTEEAFNTDASPILDSGSSPQHNHSLLFSAIPTVTIGTTVYREFRLDLNDQGTTINLDALKLYQANVGNLTSLSGATELYNMDGGTDGKTGGAADTDVSVTLTAWASGSGHSDYKILIPDSYFVGVQPGDYIYLYSAFSDANSGFEEWSVGPAPTAGTPQAVVGIDKEISIDGGNTWLDVGLYGTIAGSDTAPTLLVGSAVNYQVLLTNDTVPNASDTDPLMTLNSLIDANGPNLTAKLGGDGFNVGDANHDGKWDVGETWVYTGSTTAVDGLQIDTATANVSVTDAKGTTSGSNSDQANYIGVAPAITIEKEVSVDGGKTWFDANSATGPTLLNGYSAPVFEYIVKNTGDVALAAPTVTDDKLGTITTYTGDNGNGILDAGETWTYTATGSWAAGQQTNIGDAKDSYTDSAGHTANLHVTDPANYFGADPEIKIVKDTTGATSPGGDGILNTGDDVTATGDGISILAGSNVTWTYTVTTDVADNVPLSHVVVSDDKLGTLYDSTLANTQGYDSQGLKAGVTFTGDDGDGILQIGETWVFKATGTAIAGSYSNLGTAKGSFTDTAGNTGTDTATDGSSYTGTFTEAQAGRTQGFWSNHAEAWDGLHTNDAKWAKLIGTDISSDFKLTGAEINPIQSAHTVQLDATHSATANIGDVLLGDTNHDGLITGNEVGLLISGAVAKSILTSSVTGDHRITMLQQAIATQLNIDNHDVSPGDPWGANPQLNDKVAGDLITEAVQWLKAYGGTAFTDLVLNSSDYSTSTGKFLTALTAAQDTSFWSTSRDVDGTSSDTHATGEDLKNVLMAFNTNKLVTSASDQIGWNQNTSDPQHIVDVVGVQANGPDAFWDIVHDNIGNFGLTWHG